MAKKNTGKGSSKDGKSSERKNYSNSNGKKSYQPTRDRTTKPPSKK
uniref:Uncharacterized protein n=1 Tax=uncultured Flavobacteriia bacterium TaxID=212695 RepID=H6REY8_9BACT|nr:hypothetical protein VIS_S18BNA50030 [uncultured Flavobacteriia bacterium]